MARRAPNGSLHAARAHGFLAVVARARAALPARRDRHALPDLIRKTAAARLERRLRAGVIVVADVREEQELLERLAALAERRDPLPAEAFHTIRRLVSERTAPRLPASLAELRRVPQLGAPASERPGRP